MKKFLFVNYKWIIAIVLASNLVVVPAFAALDVWGDEITNTQGTGFNSFNAVGMGNRDPRRIASSVIQVMLGFLGVIAVILILFGGFKWMTASGNDDKVEEAKRLITAGVVGLLIVLAAFAVSIFVLNALMRSTAGDRVDIIPQND
jgi:hypothetical protein